MTSLPLGVVAAHFGRDLARCLTRGCGIDDDARRAGADLALDGADLVTCLSAWPASVTNQAARLRQDRQTRLFDLYDGARAAKNSVCLLSVDQTGVTGGLRFLGRSKVVGPGGEVLARTCAAAGLAVAEADVAAEVARARLVLHHVRVRQPAAYRTALAP